MRNFERGEIRLFGPMLVRGENGRVVHPSEWRTTKTADLLRLLALSGSEPLGVDGLIEKLWPDVRLDRARASLRTAVYQIRRVLGEDDCVSRAGNSLCLQQVWTDTQAYGLLAAEVDDSRRANTPRRTVALTREAEALYIADLDAGASTGSWWEDACNNWRAMRVAMLVDAAEAALSLNWMRDGLEFAVRAREVDPTSERAVRVVMRALAGLGETEKALTAFQELRDGLAENIGVDPSPQSRALHAQILAGSVLATDSGPCPGPAEAVGALVAVLSRLGFRRDSTAPPGLVMLHGPEGSGHELVARAACSRLGLAVRGQDSGVAPVPAQAGPGRLDDVSPLGEVVLRRATHVLSVADLSALCEEARRRGGTVVVPTLSFSRQVLEAAAPVGVTVEVVDVHPLTEAELAALATARLQGAPTRQLLEVLQARSGGLAGAACHITQQWLAQGSVVWTPDGLDLAAPADLDRSHSSRARRLLRLMSWPEVDVLSVAAVLNRDFTPEDIAGVLKALHPTEELDLEDALDLLIDRGLLLLTAGGFSLRNDEDRNDMTAWLRPATLKRIHFLVAELVDLVPVERARHLLAAGAPQPACDLAAEELRRACDAGETALASELFEFLDKLPDRIRPEGSGQPLRVHLPAVAARLSRVGALVVSAVAGASWWNALVREGAFVDALTGVA
jgi:DNA-binding SARP family transcriptional activator